MIKFNKRGQLALFVILGVIIIGLALFLILKPQDSIKNQASEFDAVFNQYRSCIEETARQGLDLAGSQGGRIDIGEFSPGSEYAPSSSHLDFLGFEVPYWYYITANGIIKEQVPKKSEIEKELENFIEQNVDCNFDNLYARGYSIDIGTPEVKVDIGDEKVLINILADMSVSKNGSSAQKREHRAEMASEFGKFYNDALRIYQKEKNESFLEQYAEDVLRLYAPVDGVELDCSPTIWKSREVMQEIKDGLEANVAHLKLKSGNYNLQKKENKYFIINEKSDGAVNFLYSQEWPTKIEIHGGEGELMVAKPIGNEAGLGIMGFCYAPYHFVYDINFPVMIQVYSNNEIFQFPVAVVIDKNVPRQTPYSQLDGLEQTDEEFDVCQYKTQDVKVEIYDVELNKVNANISYTCFEQECELGESVNGVFEGKAPACLSGLIKAKAEGYKDSQKYFSSNSAGGVDLILDKLYDVEIKVRSGGADLGGEAIVYFEGERRAAAALPDNNKTELAEGYYNVSVYVYGNSSITIPASSKRECTEITSSGILGFFGSTKEQCFDINIPESKIEKALIGGGQAEVYLFADSLEKGLLVLSVPSMPVPNSLEGLQYNYEAFEGGRVFILNE
ncbi:MAG: hypothetical protein Q8Q31_01065 [Nanoarchaeota archaeon]|nr:hypothetical protein [Nanoarchaeota archaeon]